MRNKLLFLLIIASFRSYAQHTDCDYKESIPEELYRGRYKETDMLRGNPYTMFNKRVPGWTLDQALGKVRNNIKNSRLNDSGEVEGYGSLYKELYKLMYIRNHTSKGYWFWR